MYVKQYRSRFHFIKFLGGNLFILLTDYACFILQASKSLTNGTMGEPEDDEKKINSEYQQLKLDYEDLLVLLEDQDIKIKEYKVC